MSNTTSKRLIHSLGTVLGNARTMQMLKLPTLLLTGALAASSCGVDPEAMDYEENVTMTEDPLVIGTFSRWSAAAGTLYANPNQTRVGIGTSAPQAALHVNSQDDASLGPNGEGGIMIGRSSHNHRNLQLDGNEIQARRGEDAGSLALNHEGGDLNVHLGLGTDQSARFFEDGRVAFGHTNSNHSDAKLSVDGKIVAQEVVVTTSGFPDYVFEEDYRLPSLEEIDGYIAANKHLPYLPSATHVHAKGADLGEINKALLRTVEELTLHMIEQSRELQTQREAQARLQAQLSELRDGR